MSKCPFWSNSKEKIECNNDCPMNVVSLEEEVCPFKEYLSDVKLKYKDIVKDDFQYSTDEFDGGYLGINLEKQSSNY